MNYLAATHTLPKHNQCTGKWDIQIVLSSTQGFTKMEFDNEKSAVDFICARVKEVGLEVCKIL